MLSAKPSTGRIRVSSPGPHGRSGYTGSARIGIGSPPGVENKPGIFLEIPINELRIDTSYQRPLLGHRVDSMATEWNWIACGTLTVILRGPNSGEYFVVDGQHRVEAARRAEITKLPCIVFDGMKHQSEAKEFLGVNTLRRGLNITDRYRALLITEDPIALTTKELLIQANREPSTTPNKDTVKCLDFIMRALEDNEEAITTIWPLMIEVCDGHTMLKDLLQGFFYIERYLSNTSITERLWRRRILQVGYDQLVKSIRETQQFVGKRSGAINAQGIIRALNKGLRNKLTIKQGETEFNQD